MNKMVYTCLVCKSREDKEPRRSFHTFPSDKDQRKRWMNIIGINNNVRIGITQLIICSLHFEEHCFHYGLINGRKILKDGSLPTLHLGNKPATAPNNDSRNVAPANALPNASTSPQFPDSKLQTDEKSKMDHPDLSKPKADFKNFKIPMLSEERPFAGEMSAQRPRTMMNNDDKISEDMPNQLYTGPEELTESEDEPESDEGPELPDVAGPGFNQIDVLKKKLSEKNRKITTLKRLIRRLRRKKNQIKAKAKARVQKIRAQHGTDKLINSNPRLNEDYDHLLGF